MRAAQVAAGILTPSRTGKRAPDLAAIASAVEERQNQHKHTDCVTEIGATLSLQAQPNPNTQKSVRYYSDIVIRH